MESTMTISERSIIRAGAAALALVAALAPCRRSLRSPGTPSPSTSWS